MKFLTRQLFLKRESSLFMTMKRSVASTFKFDDLKIKKRSGSLLDKNPPDWKNLGFGVYFSDHMLICKWSLESGWAPPTIKPFANLSLHPGAKGLHYGIQLFEGMKAYRGVDDKIRLFRPEMNMKRMNATAERLFLPRFDSQELIKCMEKHVALDAAWIPSPDPVDLNRSSSLYIRPTIIASHGQLRVSKADEVLLLVLLSPVGPYFPTGLAPVTLLADPQYVRAWPGGTGNFKAGGNYAPTIAIQHAAEKKGCQQVLWLFGEDHQITEAGAMNVMMRIKNKNTKEIELVTPPLSGLILPGVTRFSLLELAREMGHKVSEREITMGELVEALDEDRVLEFFACGTAAVVTPVDKIHYQGRILKIPSMSPKEGEDSPLFARLLERILSIQFGKKPKDEWAPVIKV